MNRARSAALFLLLFGAIFFTTVGYAASLTMSSSDVMALGGTGQVTVYCGASSCTITGLSWTMSGGSGTNPPAITGAIVTWSTASATGSYTVYVTLYGSGSTVLISGSATQSGSASPVSTAVTFTGSNIRPGQVASVEVDIVQTA